MQAVPEIPLSVGNKLELLLSLPLQISVHFPVHSRICPRMHIPAEYIIIRAIYNVYTVHDRGAEGFAL